MRCEQPYCSASVFAASDSSALLLYNRRDKAVLRRLCPGVRSGLAFGGQRRRCASFASCVRPRSRIRVLTAALLDQGCLKLQGVVNRGRASAGLLTRLLRASADSLLAAAAPSRTPWRSSCLHRPRQRSLLTRAASLFEVRLRCLQHCFFALTCEPAFLNRRRRRSGVLPPKKAASCHRC